MKWSEYEMKKALVRDRFDFRRYFVVVPNVSHGFLEWEADLIACTKAGYCSEVEIKVSFTDWKNDQFKDKWKPNSSGGRRYSWQLIKNFWYAAPKNLAQRWPELGIPDYAGVLAITEFYNVEVLRPCKDIEGYRKLTAEEMTCLARLGAVRIWTSGNYSL